jgi:hypothetical protein
MLAEQKLDSIESTYHELTLIWRELCLLHTQLFELTNNEYQLLLTSETDQLEINLAEKKQVVQSINDYDLRRQTCIDKLGLGAANFALMNQHLVKHLNLETPHQLEKYNDYLLDIIEKIQMQNIKNRQFLNRAMIMMEGLRKDFQNSGKVLSYNNKGNLQKHTR